MLLNLIEAITNGIDVEMEKNNNIVVFGEDVGYEGGVFMATVGLQKKYGEERCFDSVLAESSIVGSAIGMAINGLVPIAEIQFSGFVFPGYNQLVAHGARMRNRTRGKYSCPMVIRMPYGGGVRALEHHSESLETLIGHIPGLKLVIPSTPYDAKGLLISAINDPDPVVFMEPKKIYRAFKQEVPEGSYSIPLGKAKIVEEGKDITIVSWGAMIWEVLKAREELVKEGYSVEVIDLRTISPIDTETIIESVKKTGRFVVVHEAVKSFGPGAELMALVNEKAFLYLEAPPTRITSYDITMPLPKGEHYNIPDVKYILNKVKKVLEF
jgi:pyruvate dehydrogenase E1 component beta subunit